MVVSHHARGENLRTIGWRIDNLGHALGTLLLPTLGDFDRHGWLGPWRFLFQISGVTGKVIVAAAVGAYPAGRLAGIHQSPSVASVWHWLSQYSARSFGVCAAPLT